MPSYSKDTVPVVKLYGSIDQNNALIISQSNYRNIENKYSLENLLRIVLSTSLVIFVGFSLNDEFFSIFEQYRRNTSVANNWIFISPPGINSLSHNLWMKRGINILQIDYNSMVPFFKTFRDKILKTKSTDLVTKKKKQIFISSSSRNLSVVRRIRDVIKESTYNPVSVFDLPAHGQTLFEKFEKTVRESEGAIILLEEDEMSSRLNSRKIRDNVLLELGYLLAHLGKNKILILTEGNVEMPSDLSGVQFFVANSSTYRGLKQFVREWLDNIS